MTEVAIIIPVFLTLALGTIDLGLAVFRNHEVAEASRQGARIASVHGSLAPSGWDGGTWGTSAYSGTGDSADAIPTAIRNAGALAGLKTSDVHISVQWLDGSNNVLNGDCRVQVAVSTTWTPLFSYVFGGRTVTLSATSIMPIAH
jgi:Flp pilus assembly protein TadG